MTERSERYGKSKVGHTVGQFLHDGRKAQYVDVDLLGFVMIS